MDREYLSWEPRMMSEGEKEQLMRKNEQDAYNAKATCWGCSQVVVDVLRRYLNLGDEQLFKATSAFASGIASIGETCGALMGGVMTIGLAYGRTRFEHGGICLEQPDYLEAAARAGRLCDKFREKFGSLTCRVVRASIRGRPVDEDFRDYTLERLTQTFLDHHRCGNVAWSGSATRS